MIEDDILDDFERPIAIENASLGLRFVNNLVDGLFLQYGLGTLFSPFFEWLLFETNMEWGAFVATTFILNVLIAVTYYTLLEAYAGKTLGKLLTGTRVLSEDGEKPSLSQCIGRSFTRFIPIEAFSFFGEEPRGWHDRWTNTVVVKE